MSNVDTVYKDSDQACQMWIQCIRIVTKCVKCGYSV